MSCAGTTCPHCGGPLAVEDRFCGDCGRSAKHLGRRKPILWIGAAVLLGTAGLLVAARSQPNRQQDGSPTPQRSGKENLGPGTASSVPAAPMALQNTARSLGPGDDGRECYEWTCRIVAPPELLHRIQRVQYDLYTTCLDVTDKPESGFPLTGIACDEFMLQATVYFEGEAPRTLRHRLKLFDVRR